MILAHLPRTSAYVQAVGGPAVAWSVTDHLIASLIEAVQTNSYYTQIAASKWRLEDKPKPPERIRRPGDEVAVRTNPYSGEQTRSLLDAWRAGTLEMVETEAKEVT